MLFVPWLFTAGHTLSNVSTKTFNFLCLFVASMTQISKHDSVAILCIQMLQIFFCIILSSSERDYCLVEISVVKKPIFLEALVSFLVLLLVLLLIYLKLSLPDWMV